MSRYGLVALANSLDQVGPVTRTVLDSALLHELIGGHDPRDSTSADLPLPDLVGAARQGADGDLSGLKVGVIRELAGDGWQPGVMARFTESVDLLVGMGAEVVEVSCPTFVHALATYYLILPAEASSNLAKFDAMRFGLRVLPEGVESPSAEDVMRATRDAGFGDEVKRRIILGTYALSSGYYDAYYGQAQKVRALITQDFTNAFAQADVLIAPTCPTVAFPLGAKLHDPRDSTSIDAPVPPVVAAARKADVAGLRVGVVKELSGEGYETGVQERFDEAVALLQELGATVTEVSCPHFAYALPAYYLIAPSEASSNLARFDAVRYGLRVGDDGQRGLEEVMSLTRAQGFGQEVTRRIVLGTYALSSGYYDAYYGQAQKVRTLITRDFTAAFGDVDVLISPASPGVAFPLGAKLSDPLAMYRQDLATIPANLYG
ncbi:MAG: aspartyl/glutamyl-tRNA(Asn/Gln) amidotransferase subunit, partial [Marmoricola sp.]|nr:aspartyl/glutamyl-tRNA(Asn/Gln) amidotransferase subunit [Marmoricola sp.]